MTAKSAAAAGAYRPRGRDSYAALSSPQRDATGISAFLDSS